MVDDGRGEDIVHGHCDKQGEEVEERECVREAETGGPPVEGVEIEELGDPEEADQVVEAVVEDEEEPEVERYEGFTVAGASTSASATTTTSAAAEMLVPAPWGSRALWGCRGGLGETAEEADYGVSEDRKVQHIPGGLEEQRQDRGHGAGTRGPAGRRARRGIGGVIRGGPHGKNGSVVRGNRICGERYRTPGHDLRNGVLATMISAQRQRQTYYRGRQDHQQPHTPPPLVHQLHHSAPSRTDEHLVEPPSLVLLAVLAILAILCLCRVSAGVDVDRPVVETPALAANASAGPSGCPQVLWVHTESREQFPNAALRHLQRAKAAISQRLGFGRGRVGASLEVKERGHRRRGDRISDGMESNKKSRPPTRSPKSRIGAGKKTGYRSGSMTLADSEISASEALLVEGVFFFP